jgi:hypothetical protein
LALIVAERATGANSEAQDRNVTLASVRLLGNSSSTGNDFKSNSQRAPDSDSLGSVDVNNNCVRNGLLAGERFVTNPVGSANGCASEAGSANNVNKSDFELIELDGPASSSSAAVRPRLASGPSLPPVPPNHDFSNVGSVRKGSQNKLPKFSDRRPRPLMRNLTDMDINTSSLAKGASVA